jgi:adenine/guanine/hypoxanthine permease
MSGQTADVAAPLAPEGRPKKGPGPLARALDARFHFLQRGSTLRTEIGAGLGAFCVAVCGLLVTTRVIGEAYGGYAGAYLAVALICFAGTLVLGLVCRLPLVQASSTGLSAVLVALLSANSGLTYANVMLITFLAAVLHLVVTATPLRAVLVDALPPGVVQALPVGVGVLVVLTALRSSGLLTTDGRLVTAGTLSGLDRYYFWLVVAGGLLYVVLRARGRARAALVTFWTLVGAMWIGGIGFFLDAFVGGQTASTIVYERLNLVVATDGASPYTFGIGLDSLDLGALFTRGLDFSAFTAAGGSVPLVLLQGVLTFLLLGLYTNVGHLRGAAAAGGTAEQADPAGLLDPQAERRALVVGAALSVAAPVLGAPPTAIGAESAVATSDGARSGAATLPVVLGYLVALFSWVFFLVFATGTHGAGMWVEATETKLAVYVQDTFLFADLIMVVAGLAMLKGVRRLSLGSAEELLPFLAAFLGIALLGDIALGVALGVVTHLLVLAVRRRVRTLGAAGLVLAGVLVVYLVSTLV